MKKLIPAIIAMLLLCIYFNFFFQNKSKGEAILSIKDEAISYTFSASFYPGVTPQVTHYIDSCTRKLNKESARFHIKISDGDVTITADKRDNSVIILAQIKEICQGMSAIFIKN